MTKPIRIQLIPPEQLSTVIPLVKMLNPHLEVELLQKRLAEMIPQGYACVGVYLEEQLIGISGIWITTRFYCGKQIEVDNLVVHPHYRSLGIGQKLLHWVSEYGESQGCETCDLNAYFDNVKGHKFYLNEGFRISEFHFQKTLATQ